MKNKNADGFSHIFALLAIICSVGIAGVYMIVSSHADSLPTPEAQPVSSFDLKDTTKSDVYDDYLTAPTKRTTIRRAAEPPRATPQKETAPAKERAKAARAVRLSKNQIRQHLQESPMGSNCVTQQNIHNNCQAWCVYYLTWIWRRSGVKIPVLANTQGLHDWGVSRNLFHSANGGYNPRPGDAVLFDIWHTGMVSSVEGNKIRIISGNFGNKVQYQRSQNNKNLDYVSQFYVKEDNGSVYRITGFVSPQP